MRQVDHNLVRLKRQFKPNYKPPHLTIKARTKQLKVVHTTVNRAGVVKQDTQERSTDHKATPRHATMATYSDVTNLATPELKTANGLRQRYAAAWPNIEAPHTLYASQMK